MGIEWAPRRDAAGNGWRDPGRSAEAPQPTLGEAGGSRGVWVPVAARSDRPLPSPRQMLVPAGVALWWGSTGLANGHHDLVVMAGAFGLLTVAQLRQALTRRSAPSSFAVTPTAVVIDDLAIPWSAIEAVVRFSVGHTRRTVRNVLALRVGDFDNVRGIEPFWAGLANLTRRRFVILAEAEELHDPHTVVRAMDYLLATPDARLLMSGFEGQRLLVSGPPRPA